MDKKNVLAVIPARMGSSRFPGKPLADLAGKPMVIRVCEAAQRASLVNKVIIATDTKEIADVCKKHHFNVLLTRQDHNTGTDRVAEVAARENADIYVNVQGDEPLIEPETIDKAISGFIQAKGFEIANLCAKIENPSDLICSTVPKVAVGNENRAVFFSRSPIPYPKNPNFITFYRQVCVYVFTKNSLQTFSKLKQGPLEAAEEIELLRFLENGIPIKMLEVNTRSFGIDTPADLKKAIRILEGG